MRPLPGSGHRPHGALSYQFEDTTPYRADSRRDDPGSSSYGVESCQSAVYAGRLWQRTPDAGILNQVFRRGALLRNIVRAGDSLPIYLIFPCYGAGFVTMLAAGKFRRLGDLVARTVVIEERRVSVPREPIILEKIEPLPRTELGGFVPAGQTLALIEQFLSRRHVLTYRRGHAMAYVLARTLAGRL